MHSWSLKIDSGTCLLRRADTGALSELRRTALQQCPSHLHQNGILQSEALTSMLRRLGPAGGGLVPSGMAWALAPQAGSFLPGSLPRLPCTSIGALFRTNWLSGMRNELLSVLSVGDSPSSGKVTPAVLLMDLLRPEGMLEIACKEQMWT